ncbi:hypothetical protein PHMEG_0005945 [Phytophthora megakarya]|uniref:Transmembrane protein n=1 Tax=Phytophthora megakarya TaxID=4795 RepID=A0A225WQ41_9STRA|nr:hypothetical protein PHMEG_0005945 [Phytophthora megakarya]
MIHPVAASNQNNHSLSNDIHYQIVAWGHNLPSFDPVLTVKSCLLSPSSVKQFNKLVTKFFYLIEVSVVVAISLRFATFVAPASVGRIIAPISAILHFPGMIVFVSGMRVEYMKIILQTFDFWFIQTASMLWAITLSVILNDARAILVLVCWINFTASLFQETHLRNTFFIVIVSLWEWMFSLMLMICLSLGLVDEVHHYALVIARGRALSTKDVLTNCLATMTTLSLRNLYRRYRHAQHQKHRPGTSTQSLGYRCKIALIMVGPLDSSISNVVGPHQAINNKKPRTNTISVGCKSSEYLPLQMYLVPEFARIDPHQTIWPRIGALTSVSKWKMVGLYSSWAIGGGFASLSLFLPSPTWEAEVIAVCAVISSLFFSGVYTCCCQRQLLRSIVTSFHYLFLVFQVAAIGMCVIDMMSWKWTPACGVTCTLILAQPILTVDALTPVMKHRLQFTYWMVVGGIVLFWLVHAVLLLDVMVVGYFDLKDRVFLEFVFFGKQLQFYVAPFLLSRVITVLVWSARYVFVALTRHNDNALISLRGTVEFDYENWKKQVNVTGTITNG